MKSQKCHGPSSWWQTFFSLFGLEFLPERSEGGRLVRFTALEEELCIEEEGSLEMMPSFCSRFSASEKEENLKDLFFNSNLRLKGNNHQYLIFFCVRTESRGLSDHLRWIAEGEMSAKIWIGCPSSWSCRVEQGLFITSSFIL